MNVKIIDKTGKFIIYDKRNTLLITADMAQAGKLAELIQMYFSLEYWQRREVAEHGNEKIRALLRYLDRVSEKLPSSWSSFCWICVFGRGVATKRGIHKGDRTGGFVRGNAEKMDG